MKKGWFTLFFNRKQNQNYVGSLNSQEHHGVKYMSSKERQDFLKWYEENKADVFDFRKEMEEYCIRRNYFARSKGSMNFLNLVIDSTSDDDHNLNVDDTHPELF